APLISSTVSPRIRSAVRKQAIWAGVASPPMMMSKALRASTKSSRSPAMTRCSRGLRAAGVSIYDLFPAQFQRQQRVLHQRGNGHRTDATGYRCNPAALVLHVVEVDIAAQFPALRIAAVGHPGGTDVDHHRAVLDHVGSDEHRFADRDDQDV